LDGGSLNCKTFLTYTGAHNTEKRGAGLEPRIAVFELCRTISAVTGTSSTSN